MAKQSGLGDQLYVDGFDLSGDIGAVDTVSGSNEALLVTGIDKSAIERLGGLRSGVIELTSFFNPATDRAHPVLNDLPTSNRVISYFRGSAIGGSAASLVAKQVGYDPTRGDDGSLTFKTSGQSDGFALEWGDQLTAGIDTLSSAGALTGFDYGAAVGTTNFGAQAYLHVFGFAGTSATVAIQHSDDNGSGDAYANVTGAVFTAATGVTSQRIETARNQAVKRWLRVNVTGTFSDLDFAVMVVKNLTAVTF